MSANQLAALGAFLSGAGSVLGAIVTIRLLRKRMLKECQERLKLYQEGIEMGRKHDRADS